MSDKLAELIQKLSSDVKGSIDKIEALKPDKWSFGAFLAILPEVTELVKGLVIGVEKISKEIKEVSGSDKKAAVLEILNGMIEAGTIKIPWVPQWLVKKIFALAVEWIVKTYNEKFGKGKGDDPEKSWVDEPAFNVISVR